MDNEKMIILKMLESGKINSAEAAQLLQSIETPASPSPSPKPLRSAREGIPTTPSQTKRVPTSLPPFAADSDKNRSNNGPGSYSSRGFEEIVGDFGKKAGAFAREMEPKLHKLTETVASTIAGGAEKISRTLSDAAQSTAASGYSHPAPPSPSSPSKSASTLGLTEKAIEMPVSDGYCELSLSGLNGEVRIKGYNGDKITAKISYKSNKPGVAIEFMKLGGRYYLNYEQDEFSIVSIDAYVPERSFRVIKIDNLNGIMDISSLAANEITFSNANGNTRLTGLAADSLKAESSNGRLSLSNIVADAAEFENVNGLVEAEELDIAKLTLTNFNGPLSLWVSDFSRYTQYDWVVETGNAKLNMNLPAAPDLGYSIKARAAMGEIRLGLTGLQYLVNDPSMVEARSAQYDAAAKQIRLSVETSNAPLTIN